MKRTCLIAAAVLMAALLAGCDTFAAPEAGVAGSGGRVKIALDGVTDGNGRSLIQSVAESDMDYIEVIFLKTNTGAAPTYPIDIDTDIEEIYREAWMLNNIGTIGIPEGFDIADPDCEAVVFGGLKDGKILLAVGTIFEVNGNPATTAIGNGDTVTFKMVALTSEVGTATPATSSFKILTTGLAAIGNTAGLSSLPTLSYRGETVPVFQIANKLEAGTTTITASYTFEFTDKSGTAATFTDYNTYIRRRVDAPSVRSMGTNLAGGYIKAKVEVDVTNMLAISDPLPATLNLTIKPESSGLCAIFFRIPVYMFGLDNSPAPWSTTASPVKINHTKWYVQSGLDNSVFDNGDTSSIGTVTANKTGGSIVLGIGEDYAYKEKDTAEIEIGY